MKLPIYVANEADILITDQVIGSIPGVEITLSNSYLSLSIMKSVKDEVTVVILSNNPYEISFSFEKDTMCKLNVIYYFTKKTKLNTLFSLCDDTNVLLNETYLSSKKVEVQNNREFALSRNAVLNLNLGQLSVGSFVMNEEILLKDETSELAYDTLYLGSNDDLFTVTQNIRHLSKNATSNINNMIVSSNSSELNFSVNGYIAKGMSGSVCRQQNRGVILSETGSVRVDPKLYIDEYDVEAGHGAAIGQINEDEMFYLLSRGLDEINAKRLILSGYTENYLSSLEDSLFKTKVIKKVSQKIKGE
ncbi:MAG: SufD family Fe-S cluster assembly protein [Candidatus Izemoplasmatales bacterium]